MDLILPFAHFIDDYRCYKKGERIDFKNLLTIVTGDNGSGKSTLLGCIRSLGDSKWSMSTDNQAKDKLENVLPVNTDIAYLDLSADLYKGSPEFDFDNMGLYLQCRKSSSGEGAIYQLVSLLDLNKEKPLLILDEPERGLSIKKQLAVVKIIKDYIDKNPDQQIIITTHSQIFMSLSEVVYSTSHREHLAVPEYLDSMFL